MNCRFLFLLFLGVTFNEGNAATHLATRPAQQRASAQILVAAAAQTLSTSSGHKRASEQKQQKATSTIATNAGQRRLPFVDSSSEHKAAASTATNATRSMYAHTGLAIIARHIPTTSNSTSPASASPTTSPQQTASTPTSNVSPLATGQRQRPIIPPLDLRLALRLQSKEV